MFSLVCPSMHGTLKCHMSKCLCHQDTGVKHIVSLERDENIFIETEIVSVSCQFLN